MNISNFLKLTIANKKWLSNLNNSTLLRLGFNDSQIQNLKLFKTAAQTGVVPSWIAIGIPLSKIMDLGLPVTPPGTISIGEHWLNQSMQSLAEAVSSEPTTVHSIDELIEEDNEEDEEDLFSEDEETHSSSAPNNSITFKSSKDGIITEESAHDLNVKYQDCYGLYGNKVIRYLESVTHSDGIYTAYREILNGSFKMTNQVLHSDLFNMTLPKIGFINYRDYVILIERRHKKSSPARYRKGLRSDAFYYTSICGNELLSVGTSDIVGTLQDDDMSFKYIAEYVFKPTLFTYEEALEEVFSAKRIAAAFTSSFAIKLDFSTDKIVLHKYANIIGCYNEETSGWDMLTDTFNKDLLKMGVKINEPT